jgi:hypothetical protein
LQRVHARRQIPKPVPAIGISYPNFKYFPCVPIKKCQRYPSKPCSICVTIAVAIAIEPGEHTNCSARTRRGSASGGWNGCEGSS